jgi:energy-converting hydrogenase Eha subunit G
MLKNRSTRRRLAGVLIVLGALLMFLAPEMWLGVLLLAAGVGLELAGIALERKA